MTREILFRGFHKEENGKETIYIDGQAIRGKWVYGDLLHNHYVEDNRLFIDRYQKYIPDDFYENDMVEVIPETIGQYTGLNDKNGKKIFENDLLKPPLFLDDEQRICLCIYNQENNANEIIGFGLYWKNGYFSRYQDLICSDEWDEFEVIGTIFDKEVNDNE